MAEPTVAHLSIGEVLGLLLEEFPDVTISKIRFLESQGLIEPERTPSGYRKFYQADVELLRIILRQQREHFLPLRVIKDRIDSGQLEPPSDVIAKHPAAGGASSSVLAATTAAMSRPAQELAPTPASMPRPPVTQRQQQHPVMSEPRSAATTPSVAPAAAPSAAPRLLPGVLVNREELCAMASLSPAQLAQLEEYGVVSRPKSAGDLYGDETVEIAAAAGGLLRAGVDARHLRAWRTSVEREVGLFEQLVVPMLRQRNPQARVEASQTVDELSSLGARLRAALMRSAVRQSFNL